MRMRPLRTKTAILLVGEGDDDCAFLCYLKSFYVKKTGNLSVPNPLNFHGGDPWSVIQKACRHAPQYDRTLVLVDMAKKNAIHDKKEEIKASCRRFKVFPIWSSPCCLEGLLLTLLDVKKIPMTEQLCKEAWMRHSGDRKLSDLTTYEKFFPKFLIEKKRKSVSILDEIIKMIT